ncbi:heat shock 70 kDa protein [Striga asiatica]|uniref:Heat shock 70 kDa protein n=1 Tax=Striga asiatica TaxID=4170 RepID=A0A5A7QGH0_STRAF|nr:heat shock 70 kDa protein [Striga asiatica]
MNKGVIEAKGSESDELGKKDEVLMVGNEPIAGEDKEKKEKELQMQRLGRNLRPERKGRWCIEKAKKILSSQGLCTVDVTENSGDKKSRRQQLCQERQRNKRKVLEAEDKGKN